MALGVTQQLPLDDRYTYSKDYLEAQLSVLLAGRVAEILFLGKTTTGAANDFEKATEIARRMVCQWGMSELGPLTFGERDDLIFLGRELTAHKNFSEKTAELIDEEVKKIVHRNYERSETLLGGHRDQLNAIAHLLLEKEVMTSDEIKAVIEGRDPTSEAPKQETPAPPPAVPVEAKAAPAAAPKAVPGALAPEPAKA
jgi:cell division protease FtsH